MTTSELFNQISQLETNLFQPTQNTDKELTELRLLSFCMGKLSMRKLNLEVIPNSTLIQLIDHNDLSYRLVDTPKELNKQAYTLLIVFDLESGLPLVLYQNRGKNFVYNPYKETHQQVSKEDRYQGRSIELYASLPDKVRNIFSIIKFAFSTETKPIIALFIAASVTMLFNLSIPMLTNFLVSNILPQSDSKLLVEITTVVFLIVVGSSMAQYLKTMMTLRLESITDLRLQTAVWDRLVRLPMSFIDKFTTGDLASRVSAITEIRQAIGTGALTTLISSIFSISYFGLMFQYDSQLAVYAALFTLLSTLLIIFFTWKSIVLEKPLIETGAEITNFSLQAVIGLPQIRTSGTEPFILLKWLKLVNQYAFLRMKNNFYNDSKQQYATLAGPISSIIIFTALTSRLISSSDPTLFNQAAVSFIAFNAAYASFNNAFTNAIDVVAEVAGRVSVLWGRVEPILTAELEPGFKDSVQRKVVSGSFEICNLSYSFPKSNLMLFNDLSFSIPKGKHTAITGPSGCGKSTLIKFILGFVLPSSGEVLADGISIEQLSIRTYRKQFGVVMQSAAFNPGSIYDVVSGGIHRTEKDVWDALEKAAVAEEIRNLPMGLETLMMDSGGGMSGGQIQRIAIARALINNPSVLILDEATSALDNRSQKVITDLIDEMDITRISIAHRLSTIKNADNIVVLQRGVPVEIGNWENHLAMDGYLAAMARGSI